MALWRQFPNLRTCSRLYIQRAYLSEAAKNGIPKSSQSDSNSQGQGRSDGMKDKKKWYATILVGVFAAWHGMGYLMTKSVQPTIEQEDLLKEFTAKDVQKHKTKDTGVWVTYGHAVYDVTNYIDKHPGDKNLVLMAAGGPLEPYWDKYTLHKRRTIEDMLDTMKIGLIRSDEKEKLLGIQKKLIKKQTLP